MIDFDTINKLFTNVVQTWIWNMARKFRVDMLPREESCKNLDQSQLHK